MKVLYITHKPAYPKIDGGCVAMASFLDCLIHADTDVKQLTISTNKHPFDINEFPSNIRSKTTPENIHIDTDLSFVKTLFGMLKKGSFNVNRFYSLDMEKLIENTLKSNQFDFVILESLFTTPYLKTIRANFNGQVFYRAHNIEHKIWKSIAQGTRNPLKKLTLKKLTKDLKKYELDIIHQVDAILTLSSSDKRFIELHSKTNTVDIPFSLVVKRNNTNDYAGNSIFHLGNLNWSPNLEAVNRLTKIISRIQSIDLKLNVIGKTNTNLKSSNHSKVNYLGFVEDFESTCQSIGILVTPIVSGSGIRIKILEMMNIGIPVITTSIGALGIDHTKSKCLIVADTDEEISAAIIDLHSNYDKRKTIGSNGFDYIHKHHNIQNSSKKLSEFLQSR